MELSKKISISQGDSKKNSEAHGPVNNSKTLMFAKFDL
jgi:hypothetical protein